MRAGGGKLRLANHTQKSLITIRCGGIKNTMKTIARWVLGAALAAVPMELSMSGILADLSADQQKTVLSGEEIVVTEAVKGHVWPRVSIYRIVNASPEQVAAVFFDYTTAKEYVPNVFKSDISKVISPCVIEVDYSLDIPILPDEHYTARNSLTARGGSSYAVDWLLLRAAQTKASVGSLHIEPREGKSLIRYRCLTTPGSSMAGLLRAKAVSQMSDTVAAIAKQVETRREKDPAGLAKQVDALHKATAAEAGN